MNNTHTDDEITITLLHPLTNQTESIEIQPQHTTLESLRELACALLPLEFKADDDSIGLWKHGQVINGRQGQTLKECGIVHGDVIAVVVVTQDKKISNNDNGSGNGGLDLDFSSLLHSANGNGNRNSAFAGGGGGSGAGGALDFSSLLSSNSVQSISSSSNMNTVANNNGSSSFSKDAATAGAIAVPPVVHWNGMSIEDAMEYNPNPDTFIQLILDPKYESLFKLLNFHIPTLGKKLFAVKDNRSQAVSIYREFMVQSSIAGAVKRTSFLQEEHMFRQRLRDNPNDAEAKLYFEKKKSKLVVQEHFRRMMEEYPEAMGRVLMLYIKCEILGTGNSNNELFCNVQAFVDSGAQMTIMSKAFAQKLNLLHLLDDRFQGMAKGVGTGKILGRIHIVELRIGSHIFPCSVTVLDNQDMDFLLGLDMLKRHRCQIDLGRNCLIFPTNNGPTIEAPFLHEKDLDVEKGGTKGFNAEIANKDYDEMMSAKSDEKDNDADMKD